MSIKIGPQTIDYIANQVKGLLLNYQTELNSAYVGMGDDPLSISLTTKISPDFEGNSIETNMKFSMGQVKDKISGSVNEEQLGLFPPQTEEEPGLTIYPPTVVGRPKLYGRLGW